MKMSIKELSGYYDYTVLTKALEEEILFLYQKSARLTQSMNGKEGRAEGNVSDIVGNSASLIAQRKSELERMKAICEYERERISGYILHDISDGLVRTMMYARFIKLMPWYKVAMYVGGGNTADSCRKAVFRFCREHENR